MPPPVKPVALALAISFSPSALATSPAIVDVSPAAVQVDDETTLTFTITATGSPLAKGDLVMLYDPVMHGERWPTSAIDTDPAHCGSSDTNRVALVTARVAPGTATLALSRSLTDNKLHRDGITLIKIAAGEVAAGSVITVVVGNTTDDSDCALTVGTRALHQLPWEITVLRSATGRIEPVINPPTLDIHAYETVHQVIASLPCQATLGEEVDARIAVLDSHSNPVHDYAGQLSLSADSSVILSDSSRGLRPDDGAVWTTGVRPLDEGVLRLEVLDADGAVVAESNPMIVCAKGSVSNVYWGDLHVHHGHHYTDDDGNLVDQKHDYARDVMGYQVGSESQKSGSLEIDADDLWVHLKTVCDSYTSEGSYVALLVFEWAGERTEGHHNVYFDSCDGPLADDGITDLGDPATSLFAFQTQVATALGIHSLAVPHATTSTGYNWTDHDDDLRPLAEIYSQGWGFSDELAPMGGGVYDGIAGGLKLGFIASSDNHRGWMGNNLYVGTGSSQGSGLAAYVTTDLSRAAIFGSMATRSTYATTGQRAVLAFWADDGGEVLMGEQYVAESPTFHWEYAPEDEIAEVELLSMPTDGSGSGTLMRLKYWTPSVRDASAQVAYGWDGITPTAVWLHVTETDGHEAWSSPIWLTADCTEPGVADPAGRCGP